MILDDAWRNVDDRPSLSYTRRITNGSRCLALIRPSSCTSTVTAENTDGGDETRLSSHNPHC
ncbi:unnamed protein product [Chondrus crispus]|uniref:Uncharacterized protein n=1 Tax=Chondrus crispus TaxID=2769 RepID=R7QTY9_CHOCR|nr:unnamed protein product [Chondrus crispus]CDF40956.1 unnamed protein product [Chondrus crispus]|eukprot:XP_005711250.1 unnamed protein product [Chondrus crispus]